MPELVEKSLECRKKIDVRTISISARGASESPDFFLPEVMPQTYNIFCVDRCKLLQIYLDGNATGGKLQEHFLFTEATEFFIVCQIPSKCEATTDSP